MSEKKKRTEGNKNIKANFPVILEELFGGDTVCFDTLMEATLKDITPVVYSHCKSTSVLNYGRQAEDIIQEILLRVFKTCIPQFFCRPEKTEINTSSDEFWFWVLRICRNKLTDEFNKSAKKGNKESFVWQYEDDETEVNPIEEIAGEPEAPEQYAPLTSDAKDYIEDKLSDCFNIVMTTGGNVYKPLTWLIQSVFVLKYNMTRIEANALMEEKLGDKTLYEIYDMFIKMSESVIWMTIAPESLETITKGLAKKDKSGKCMGEKKFRECYMAAGAKKSYSDWVNREDGQINKKFDEEAEKKKSDEDDEEDK